MKQISTQKKYIGNVCEEGKADRMPYFSLDGHVWVAKGFPTIAAHVLKVNIFHLDYAKIHKETGI